MIEVAHRDGYRAFARWWAPPQPRGAVLYLHGIQSHGGWYEQSGQHLADAGLAVLMPDRRGSGRNLAGRGHADVHEQWLRDLEDAIAMLCERAGVDHVHVVGVSWGGKLAAAAAGSGIERIASLTLIAPGIFPRIDLPVGEKMKIAWSLVADRERTFPIPLDDARLFTANPERMAWVDADPHRLRAVTGPFLVASRRLDRRARDLPESAWGGPVLLLTAEHDRIIDNVRTRQWFARLRGPRRRLIEYAGTHHTLEFEPDPDPMRRDVREWILGHCQSAALR